MSDKQEQRAGAPRAGRRPRAGLHHEHSPCPRRSTRNLGRFSLDYGNNRVAPLALQNTNDTQELGSRSAAQATSSSKYSQLRKAASETSIRRAGLRKARRPRMRSTSRRRGRTINGKIRTDSDSESNGRGDSGSNSGSGVDGMGGGTRWCTSFEKKDAAGTVVEELSHVVSSSSHPAAEGVPMAAEPTTGSEKISGLGPNATRETAQPSYPPAAVGISETVDPFHTGCSPGVHTFFRRPFPCPLFHPEMNALYESLSLPSFFVWVLDRMKEKPLWIPPPLTVPMTVLLLITCVGLSSRLVLLLAPLRQASFRLLNQHSFDLKATRIQPIRYCQHLPPLDVNTLVPAVVQLPFTAEELTRSTAGFPGGTHCQACPENAVCEGGSMKCLPHYIRVPAATLTKNHFFAAVTRMAKKFFGRSTDEGDVCAENAVARRAAEKVVEQIVLRLRRRAGDSQCDSPKICTLSSPDGRTCRSAPESRKRDSYESKEGGNKYGCPSGTMTRWELLQYEDLREQLDDDSVYAYVFDRLLEEKAAMRLNIQVKHQYSFESMRLPREASSTPSASPVNPGGLVAFFLREQRRSHGITYSYTYVGPHTLRSPFCTFRLVVVNVVIPLCIVILTLFVLVIPVALWLRRFYLRRQLLVLLQQQQLGEQETLTKSWIRRASGAPPVGYRGCSSAHLSQLLVQQSITRPLSLLRWWLLRTASKVEEVDTMCFELLHSGSAGVQTRRHDGQNYWWVEGESSPSAQHTTADSTKASTHSLPAGADGHDARSSTPLSLNSWQAPHGLLDCPGDVTDSVLAAQFSMPLHRLSYSAWRPRPDTYVDAYSSAQYEPGGVRRCVPARTSVQLDECSSQTIRCAASLPRANLATTTCNSSTTAAATDPWTYLKELAGESSIF